MLRGGDPRATESFYEAVVRMEPFPVNRGVILSDENAPLEPLVRATMEYMRHRTRQYVPANVLYH